MWGLSVKVIGLYVGGYLCLPLVSIVEELLLVVEQLFMGLSGKLKVGALQKATREKGIGDEWSKKKHLFMCVKVFLSTLIQGHTHLYNGINRTRLLTETAVDAFGHVDVIASRPPAAISTGLSFDGYGLDTNTKTHT